MSGQAYTDPRAGSAPDRWEFVYQLEKITAIILAGLALYLAVVEPLIWLPVVLGGVAVFVLLFVDWPYGAFLELCIAASMPRWFVKINKWHAKPEHFVAAAVGLILLSRLLRRKHEWKSFEKPEILVFAFLVLNFFTSTVVSPDRGSTLRWALLLTLAVSPYFLIGQLVRSRKQLDQFMIRWLWVGTLGALFGILCFFSFTAFHTELGVTVFDFLGYVPAVHGTMWEPNIFGSYCTIFAVMFLFYFLSGKRRNPWYLAGFLVTTVGAILSLARQGWLCLILVGGLILFYTLRRTKVQLKYLLPIVASIMIALVVGFSVSGDLTDRITSMSLDKAEDDPTVARRAGLIILATQDIREHPILGLGTSSFQLLYIADSDTTYQGVDNAWLGSLFFGIMHDTGVIGMGLYLWLIFSLGRRAWRILAAPVRASTNTAVGALSAGVLVMLIAYQFTDASTLAFTWVQFGLLVAALRVAEDAATTPSALPA